MFEFFKKETATRWVLGLILSLIALSMVTYLVPGQGGQTGNTAEILAEVGGQDVTVAEVQRTLGRLTSSGRQIPPQLRGLYARQILDQLVDERLIEMEAKRLGIQVTDEERSERIKQLLPGSFAGGSVASMETYASEVQTRFQMSVPEFEELLRKSLLENKIRRLVTDGISVGPAEVEEEFHRKNEKVTLDYVVVKPQDLAAKVEVSDADLAAFFQKNKARYQLPERRAVRYALLDSARVRQSLQPDEAAIRSYYDQHIDLYRLQNRVHASHILLKTVGKTDAEVEEIRKKAAEVLAKLKKGAKFEDLAKQYSEDTNNKDKGGDLGWLVGQQTVPEFEKAAFALNKGETSDLVKTAYGFHIIRVLDKEIARTKTVDEVRSEIVAALGSEQAERKTADIADKMAAAVRQSSRRPLDDIAKEFGLTVRDVPAVSATEPIGELGNTPDIRDVVFRATLGELSSPLRIARGYVILVVKEIQQARQGTLEEVRGKVEGDFRTEKSIELASQRAEQLAQKTKAGEAIGAAAKGLGLEMKTSQPLTRADSIPDAGTVRRLTAAFTLPVGETSPAINLGSSWVVFRVSERQEAQSEELEKQRVGIHQELLQSKQQLAYEAFRTNLKDRMRREGKLRVNEDNVKRLGSTI
jgi:peptidyl-prolyl cis-trans isomerase D